VSAAGRVIPTAALRDDLARRVFRLGAAPAAPRIGAEVELIPVDAETGAVVPVLPAAEGGRATLPLLRRFGARHGWREEPSPYGVPCFALPGGGVVSYEPGGQIELSAGAAPSVQALVRSLRATVGPLARLAREEGIELLSLGIHPAATPDDVPLQLPGKRYVRLTEFMEWAGTGGTRMMRLTASFQVSLDWGAEPLARWRLLNALAPYTVAVFAHSPLYRGAPTGDRSFRARVWRELDGGRTGIFACGDDPVGEYLDFALRAPAILLGEVGEFRPFAEWNAAGRATEEAWRTHLSTLFPEVRPKEFVEVRSPDAVAPEWYAAPLVWLAGLTHHPAAAAEAAALVGAPDPERLARAGRDGVADPETCAAASALWEVALRGAEALGEGFVSGEMREEARAFADRYTRRGRCPADDVLAASSSVAAAEPAPPVAAVA
jgi:glutamate--cysteine ligase